MTTQEKILALAEKLKNPPSWWWKVLGGVLVFLAVVWIYWTLTHKERQLAEARNALAKQKLEAMKAEVAARVESDTVKRKEAEAKAAELLKKVVAEEAAITAAEERHAKSVAQLSALESRDWETLNKLAGIK